MVSSENALGETYKGDLGQRLKIVAKKFQSREEAAKAAGVSKPAFEKWVYGASSPSFESIVRLSVASSLSLDWIAFGINADLPVSDDYAAGVEPPDNYNWMKEILDLLGDVYRFAGHNPPPASYVHEAADIYMNVLSWEKSEDRSRAISLAIASLAPHIKPPEALDDQRSA